MATVEIICSKCNSTKAFIVNDGQIVMHPCSYCIEKAEEHGFTHALSLSKATTVTFPSKAVVTVKRG